MTNPTDTEQTGHTGHTGETEPDDAAPEREQLEVGRNRVLAAGLGSLAGLVAAAYLVRAASSGSWVDWLVFAAIGTVAVVHGLSFLDARTPLLVADRTGIRIRLGRSWHGLPWGDLEEVEHAPRTSWLRDGRLVAFPLDPDAALADLDPAARRQAAVAERVHGAAFAVPLGLTTVVSGAPDGVTAALLALAPAPELIVEVVAEESHAVEAPELDADEPDPGELDPGDLDTGELPVTPGPDERPDDTMIRPNPFRRALRGTERAGVDDTVERPRPLLPTRTPSPLREPSRAVRSDVTRPIPMPSVVVGSSALVLAPDGSALPELPEAEELRRRADDYFAASADDTGVWRSTTVVIDQLAGPAIEPVIGPQLVEARTQLGLEVEQLAERTRIRAHVIDAIEIDDFDSCGGDFYARGHLRTLARVLNLDAVPLLMTYDERYAHAPIDPRRVFEAELSTGAGGSIRSLRGGPNWSVIVAAVMAVVLAWSIARLVMDQPQDSGSQSPSLSSGSAGLTSGRTDLPPAVPVVLKAAGGGAKVTVRDGAGTVVFKGALAFGQSRTLRASPPVRVQTNDGSLTVGIDGQDASPIGRTGRSARDTFVP